METPKGSGSSTRPSRLATPRLSERKRQLFGSPVRLRKIADNEDEDVDILGISPLKPQGANKPTRSLFGAAESEESTSGTSSSPETNKENKRSMRSGARSERSGVVAAASEQLPHLFTTTMRLNSNSSSSRNSSPRTPKTHRAPAVDSDLSSADSEEEYKVSNTKPQPKVSPSSIRRSPRTSKQLRDQEKEVSFPVTAKLAPRSRRKSILKSAAPKNIENPGTGKKVEIIIPTSSIGTPRSRSSKATKLVPEITTPRSSLRIARSIGNPDTKVALEANTPKSSNSRVGLKAKSDIGTPRRSHSPTTRKSFESHTSRSSTRTTRSSRSPTTRMSLECNTPRSSIRAARSSLSPTVLESTNTKADIGTPLTIKANSLKSPSPLELPESDDEEDVPKPRQPQKRAHPTQPHTSSDTDSGSPQTKLRKMNLESSIPTMAFYSRKSPAVLRTKPKVSTPRISKSRANKTSPTVDRPLGINKGVGHKIKKPPRPGFINRPPSTDLDNILSALSNERLKNLIINRREERAKVEEVHQILNNARDPIKMAKPLSVIVAGDANNNSNYNVWQQTEADFSDLSEDEEQVLDVMEPIIPLIRHEEVDTSPPAAETVDLSKRKFFKSGRRSSTCMEVKITDNIRASVVQGKISLVQKARRKPRGVHVKSATIFSAEQATVDAILKNLNDSVFGEIVESEPMDTGSASEAMEYIEPVIEVDPYAPFRQRLPYQTDDPQTIEQQQILLEFLISNNICTEENFKIFIADPDNHKDEANRIVDELYMVVNCEEAAQGELLPTSQPQVEPPLVQQDIPKVPQVEPPLLFPIFTQRLQPLVQKSTRRRPETSRLLTTAAGGSNQYQIDAGQKAFGARQCQQCGLVYTVHEPEEEQLHREYHNSIHVLRFKGWIDEDLVAVYPEWACDGRIIRMNERAPAVRLERLRDLIGVVDKELGYSSYIVPKVFIAFIAVRKQQIVGFCLVQPLTQAHRFIQVDGTDYFSEESYEASCGVSRIWVSPLQRRRGIASKLMRAVQCHTVIGQEIAFERIAFSTPTDDGRALARHITGLDNFLTYDQ
ncbi:hypothetical protein KR009_003808 [Drosophila setifemur]|nr:hypothetical protein KR009_003808 [Drosophila setifemur]